MQKFKALKDPEGKEKVDGEFENQRKQVVKELSKEGNLKASRKLLQCLSSSFY